MTDFEHEIEAREARLRHAALETWGAEHDITPEEVERLQGLEPALQDREIEARGFVFVCCFQNHYHCEDCDNSWSDSWCATCDDECGLCHADIEAEESEVVDVEIIKLKSERCSVCGETHEF